MSKTIRILLIVAGLAAIFLLAALLLTDAPYEMNYHISMDDTPNQLSVSLDIHNPVTAKKKTILLYLPENALLAANNTGNLSQDGLVRLQLERGNIQTLSYKITLGSVEKHGMRGRITDTYCVFDGAQVFAFPATLEQADLHDDTVVIGNIGIHFDLPRGWISLFPYVQLSNVTWMDAYNMGNNCFAAGRFQSLPVNTDNLNVFTLKENSNWAQQDIAGIEALYQYYTQLFSNNNTSYTAIFLPAGDSLDIIGGAGQDTVCATFDPEKKRDWELLSHRMFHAGFDQAFPIRQFHFAPYLWLYEGMATYYENIAVTQLPNEIMQRFNITEKGQFSILFNRYLYFKHKDPLLFSLAPMNEEKILDSYAQTEFLHYIQAPLIVYHMESVAGQHAGKSDILLHYLLESMQKKESINYDSMLRNLLEQDAPEIWNSFFISSEVLPLWILGNTPYTEEQIIKDLRDTEKMLASWMVKQLGHYPADPLETDMLPPLVRSGRLTEIVYTQNDMQQQIGEYSPLIDTLLREYYLRAQVCSLSPDDPMLRYKLLGDGGTKNIWEDWLAENISKS